MLPSPVLPVEPRILGRVVARILVPVIKAKVNLKPSHWYFAKTIGVAQEK